MAAFLIVGTKAHEIFPAAILCKLRRSCPIAAYSSRSRNVFRTDSFACPYRNNCLIGGRCSRRNEHGSYTAFNLKRNTIRSNTDTITTRATIRMETFGQPFVAGGATQVRNHPKSMKGYLCCYTIFFGVHLVYRIVSRFRRSFRFAWRYKIELLTWRAS